MPDLVRRLIVADNFIKYDVIKWFDYSIHGELRNAETIDKHSCSSATTTTRSKCIRSAKALVSLSPMLREKLRIAAHLLVFIATAFVACNSSMAGPRLFEESADEFVYERAPVWIWADSQEGNAFFRKTIQVMEHADAAEFTLTADGAFQLFINGKFVAQNDKWSDVERVPVIDFLVPGQNTIAVAVRRKDRLDRGFVFDGWLRYRDGRQIRFSSDETWRATVQAPQDRNWIRADYDDRHWSAAVFHAELDDSAWPGTQTRFGYTEPAPPPPRRARKDPSYRKIVGLLGQSYARFAAAELNPAKVFPVTYYICEKLTVALEGCQPASSRNRPPRLTEGRYVVFDFGEEQFGSVALVWRGAPPRGANLVIASGEDETQLVAAHWVADAMISGEAEFREPRRRALRWLALRLRGGAAEIDQVYLEPSGYPVANQGYFASADSKLNRIWQTGVRTVRLNMQRYYWDGILRDRALWVGDFLEAAKTNYYSFGDWALAKKSLYKLALHRNTAGEIRAQIGIGNASWYFQDYSLKWVTALRDYYDHTGDLAFVHSMAGTVVAQLDVAATRLDNNGLLTIDAQQIAAPAYDWSSSTRQGVVAYHQVVYYKTLLDAVYLLHAVGDLSSAARYSLAADRLRTRTLALLYDPQLGLLEDLIFDGRRAGRYSQDSNVLALDYSLIHASKAAKALSALESLWTPFGTKLISKPYGNDFPNIRVKQGIGPMMISHEVAVRIRHGQVDQAIELTKRTFEPMLDSHSKTFWEFVGLDGRPETPTTSLCHGWSGNIVQAFSAELLGIKPAAPGFAAIAFAPQPGSLRWVHGVVPTPRGLVAVKILNAVTEEGRMYYTIYAPRASRVHFSLPVPGKVKAVHVNGKHLSISPGGTHPASGLKNFQITPVSVLASTVEFDSEEGGEFRVAVTLE